MAGLAKEFILEVEVTVGWQEGTIFSLELLSQACPLVPLYIPP
jgi:hypothetical protein